MWDRGNFEAAFVWAERALEIEPRHPGAGELAGNALIGVKPHEDALGHLQVAADRGSESACAQVGLQALGRLEEAEVYLRRL